MNARFNGETLAPHDAIRLQSRGFRYGDGCFETLLVLRGKCPLLAQHEARIRKSLAFLEMDWPQHLQLEEQLHQLGDEAAEWQRVRLWLWRAGGGLYAPQSSETETMLAWEPCQRPAITIKQTVSLSEEVVLTPTGWSFIKNISALPYVIAGREKQRLAADELILLNHRGEATEATSANLFFKKRKRWYTPALSTGCVAGVMRAWLMKQLLNKGESVFEVHAQAEELQNIDKLVCTNVTGLQPIAQLLDKRYDTDVDELWSLMPAEYR